MAKFKKVLASAALLVVTLQPGCSFSFDLGVEVTLSPEVQAQYSDAMRGVLLVSIASDTETETHVAHVLCAPADGDLVVSAQYTLPHDAPREVRAWVEPLSDSAALDCGKVEELDPPDVSDAYTNAGGAPVASGQAFEEAGGCESEQADDVALALDTP